MCHLSAFHRRRHHLCPEHWQAFNKTPIASIQIRINETSVKCVGIEWPVGCPVESSCPGRHLWVCMHRGCSAIEHFVCSGSCLDVPVNTWSQCWHSLFDQPPLCRLFIRSSSMNNLIQVGINLVRSFPLQWRSTLSTPFLGLSIPSAHALGIPFAHHANTCPDDYFKCIWICIDMGTHFNHTVPHIVECRTCRNWFELDGTSLNNFSQCRVERLSANGEGVLDRSWLPIVVAIPLSNTQSVGPSIR